MHPSTRAPRGALLLYAGGVLAAVASFLPWARLPVLSVRGVSTAWGIATLVAGAVGALAGYRRARGYAPNLTTRLLVVAAGVIAVLVPAVVAGDVHRELVEQRLDAHLAPHGLTAADVLGAEGHPSLFETFAPFLSGEAAQLVSAVNRSMTVRTDVGLWLTLAGGAAMTIGALATSARRQRHNRGAPEGDVMTTNTITVTGMTCGGCARRVRRAVSELPGVTDVDVQVATGTVTITSDTEIDDISVRSAVETAGYAVAS